MARTEKFATPNEPERAVESCGLRVTGERGAIYRPIVERLQLSSDRDVNYMLAAVRAEQKGNAQ